MAFAVLMFISGAGERGGGQHPGWTCLRRQCVTFAEERRDSNGPLTRRPGKFPLGKGVVSALVVSSLTMGS